MSDFTKYNLVIPKKDKNDNTHFRTVGTVVVYDNGKKVKGKVYIDLLDNELLMFEATNKNPNHRNYTGDKCSICYMPQFDTPSGVTCQNNHGGAPSIPNDPDDEIPF